MGNGLDRKWNRRDYLAAIAAAGIGGFAGCNGSDDGTDTKTDNESVADSEATSDGESEDDEKSAADESDQQPELEITDKRIDTDRLVIGSEITVTATVENVGGNETLFDIEMDIVDERHETSVELEPGDYEEFTVSAIPMTVGTGDITLNDEHLSTVDVIPVASEDDRTVGTYYFTWYGREPHTWRDGEWSLESPYTPTLGNYNSADPEVVEQHIDWCHYAGVQWLNAVWTGPGGPIDDNLKNHILPHPRASELAWSIFYDTLIIHHLTADHVTEVDLSDEHTASKVKEYIAYVADEYFDREYYKTIDGRPVLTTWLGGSFTGDPAAVFTEAFEEAGVDPYFIVGIGNQPIDAVELTEIADAVTLYMPYMPRDDIEEVFLNEMESLYRSWYLGTQVTGQDVVPTVIPGFNDTEITHVDRDNPVLEVSTERYANACQVGHQYAEGPILVTAFNEWYESTFIEPSEEFGTSFLEITADRLAVNEWESPIADGSMVTLSFEQVVPATEMVPGTDDDRDLTMRVYELRVFDAAGEQVLDIDVGGDEDGVDFVIGYFPAESNGETSRWLGGRTDSTLFFPRIDEIGRLEVTGWAGTDMDVIVTVDNETLGTTQVTEQRDTYTIE